MLEYEEHLNILVLVGYESEILYIYGGIGQMRSKTPYLICSQCEKKIIVSKMSICKACFMENYNNSKQIIKDCQNSADDMQSRLWAIESRISAVERSIHGMSINRKTFKKPIGHGI